jgi:hypothetical protein
MADITIRDEDVMDVLIFLNYKTHEWELTAMGERLADLIRDRILDGIARRLGGKREDWI